jgi:hypothetical protein
LKLPGIITETQVKFFRVQKIMDKETSEYFFIDKKKKISPKINQ